MARMTASDFISEVRLALGETSETVSDTQILRWVNRSYLQLCSAVDMPELRTTSTLALSSGTAEYSVGFADDIRIDSMIDTTHGYRLEYINEYQYETMTQTTDTISGSPYYWFISGSDSSSPVQKKVTFFPTPNETTSITVSYTKKPTELVTSPSATSPVINEAWDEPIINRAIANGWRVLGDESRAERWVKMSQQADMAAMKTVGYSSDVPIRPGSVVGGAIRGI